MAIAKNALDFAPETPQKEYGIAKVKTGPNKARLVFADGTTYTFPLTALPKHPHIAPNSDEDLYMVVLSPEKDKVEKIGPAEGHFLAKCIDFMRPDEDSDPAPADGTYHDKKTGKDIPYQKFTAVFKILNTRFKGVEVLHFLRYKFRDNNGVAGWDGKLGHPNAIHLPRLVEFCTKTGCVDSPIPWPEDGNILPELLSRILEADKVVDLTIKDGYISSIMFSDVEGEEDEAPKPKPKAKAKAPASKDDEFDDVPNEDDDEL